MNTKQYIQVSARLALIAAFSFAFHYWRASSFSPLVDDFTIYFVVGLAGAIGMLLFGDAERAADQQTEIEDLRKAVKALRARPVEERNKLTPPNGNPRITADLAARLDRKMTHRIMEDTGRRPALRVVSDRATQGTFTARRSNPDSASGRSTFNTPYAMVPMGFLPKLDVLALPRFVPPPPTTMRFT